jgi:hypothetical protein
MVPPGWLRTVADPLTKTWQWTGIVDQVNHSECSLLGELKAARTGPGTYRCKGPLTAYDDVAIEVDLTLGVAGACGGIWFRFGRVPETSQEAGYLLKVCEGGVALATHGVPDSARITDVWTHPAPATVGKPVRVGILARGDSIEIFLDGQRVGTVSDSTFHSGRITLGIVVSPPADSTRPYAVRFRDVGVWRPPA